MKQVKQLLIALSLSFVCVESNGQTSEDFNDEPVEVVVTGSRVVEEPNTELISVLVEALGSDYSDLDYQEDEEMMFALREMLLTLTRHETRKISDRREALWFNKITSNIAFLIAHTLLFVGFIIGYREYNRINLLKSKGEKLEDIEISIVVESIALKATLGATMTLVFCFGYYFLYLVLVFPIVAI